MTMRLTVDGNGQDVVFDNPIRQLSPSTYLLGAVHIGSRVAENAHIKLYNFRLMEFDKAVMDFIPVRIGDVGYMYDRVTKQLFGNDGTGAFVLGPDIN